MIAFLPTLGWQEMFLLVVIGLLLYGRDLPHAGRSLGRAAAQMKRGFQDFKDRVDRPRRDQPRPQRRARRRAVRTRGRGRRIACGWSRRTGRLR